MASMADTAIFLLVGICAVDLGPRGCIFGLWVMLFCLCGRATAVFPIGALTNFIKERKGKALGKPPEAWNLLPPKSVFMMWHAGLRGGIALVLCMELGPWVDKIETTCNRHTLQTATYLLIIVFLMVFGGSTESCLRKLKVPMGKEIDSAPDSLYKTEMSDTGKETLGWLNDKVSSSAKRG